MRPAAGGGRGGTLACLLAARASSRETDEIVKAMEHTSASAWTKSRETWSPVLREIWGCRPSKKNAAIVVAVAGLYCLSLVTLTAWKPGAAVFLNTTPTTIIVLCAAASALSEGVSAPDRFRPVLRACFFYTTAAALFSGAWLVMADVSSRSFGSGRGKCVSLALAIVLWLAVVLVISRYNSFTT